MFLGQLEYPDEIAGDIDQLLRPSGANSFSVMDDNHRSLRFDQPALVLIVDEVLS